MTINPKVLDAIERERQYQDAKWGANKQQSLPGYLAIMRAKLSEAEEAWLKGGEGRHSTLSEIVQAVTTGIRALETYGVTGCAVATNDRDNPDWAETKKAFGSTASVRKLLDSIRSKMESAPAIKLAGRTIVLNQFENGTPITFDIAAITKVGNEWTSEGWMLGRVELAHGFHSVRQTKEEIDRLIDEANKKSLAADRTITLHYVKGGIVVIDPDLITKIERDHAADGYPVTRVDTRTKSHEVFETPAAIDLLIHEARNVE